MPEAGDDCFAHSGRLMLHEEAIALLRGRLVPLTGVESTALTAALGRVVARSVLAPRPVPAHTNAAVDGYAFAHGEYDAIAGTTFDLAGRAAAGHPLGEAHRPGTAVRILTGAALPEGADTIAMQEDCRVTSRSGQDAVAVGSGLRRGANVRRAGEDVTAGQVLLEAGTIVRPQDIAALAAVGLAEVECHRRLRIAIASTGDELVPPGGAAATPGHVYDANAPMLLALASLAGCDARYCGIWRDRHSEVRASLARAADEFDVVVTSGGASRGDEDHLAAALAELGSRHFWQLAIKPGRPMMFGRAGRSIVIGLPGNPVAVFVCFLLYVWPVLRRLSGAAWPEARRLKVRAAFDFRGRKRGRREFWRGSLVETPEGLAAAKFARDGSGLVSGLRAADGLIEIPEDAGDVQHGDEVAFIPFTEFGIVGR